MTRCVYTQSVLQKKECINLKKILSLLLVLMLIPVGICANANNISVKAQYDQSENIVRLTGYAMGRSNIVLSETGEKIDDFNSGSLPLDVFKFKSYGKFIYTFKMPEKCEPGKYDVHLIDSAEASASASFIYFSAKKADELSRELSKIGDYAKYKKFIADNAFNLGTDPTEDIFINNIDEASRILFECENDFNDSASFIKKFNACLALAELRGKKNEDVERIIKDYEEELDIDYSADFENNSNYTDEIRKKALSLLAESDYVKSVKYLRKSDGKADFKEVLNSFTVLSRIKTAESYESLKTIYENYLPNILKSDSRYTKTVSKSVFKELIKLNFVNLPDMEDNFEIALNKAIKNNSGSGTGSSGTGGSSSGGGPSASINTPVNSGYDPSINESAGTNNPENTARGYKITKLIPGNASFSDLPTEHWGYNAVSSLYASGIISGYENGTFQPSKGITRAEFAKLMVAAFNFTGNPAKRFSDVADDQWFSKYVNVAADNDIINGYDGKFNPNDNIKRQDAILIAYRAAQAVGVSYSGTYNFDDLLSADTYSWPAIISLSANKIITGDNNNFVNPQNEITRVEAAQVIFRLLTDINERIN